MERPEDSAASVCPSGTAWMPATTISQMKHAARLLMARMAAGSASRLMPTSGKMKKTMKICTRNGVPRMRSTQMPMRPLSHRLCPAREDPEDEPDERPREDARTRDDHGHPQPLQEEGQALYELAEIKTPHGFGTALSVAFAKNEPFLGPQAKGLQREIQNKVEDRRREKSLPRA